MRFLGMLLALALIIPPVVAQEEQGPSSDKAKKAYNEALGYLRKRMIDAALSEFKKADKQDGGHCVECQREIIKYGIELRDWKSAEFAASELVTEAKGDKNLALAHYEYAVVLMDEALDKRKDEFYNRAHEEFVNALASAPNFPRAVFVDGQALAHLKQDDAAKARFEQFVLMKPPDDLDRQRALRYIADPELARARMAPPFAITTTDGQRVSLDELKGKVVLMDFWATWCGPCREALPHIRQIAKKFEDEPIIVLSVSLDEDEQKWKDFVAKNNMTWSQYREPDGFRGPIARVFGVEAIPHTFTIDADGVLQDERIGDASIEGKLKKLVSRAREQAGVRK